MSNRKTKTSQPDLRATRAKVGFTADELSRLDALRIQAGFKTRSAYIRARSLGYRPPHNALTRHNDEALLLLHKIARQLSGSTNNLNQIAKVGNTTQVLGSQDLEAVASAIEDIRRLKQIMVRAAAHIVDMTLCDEDIEP